MSRKLYFPSEIFSKDGEFDVFLEEDSFRKVYEELTQVKAEIDEIEEKLLYRSRLSPQRVERMRARLSKLKERLVELEKQTENILGFFRVSGLSSLAATGNRADRATVWAFRDGRWQRIEIIREVQERIDRIKAKLEREYQIFPSFLGLTYPLAEKLSKEIFAKTERFKPFQFEVFRQMQKAPVFLPNGKTLLVSAEGIEETETNPDWFNTFTLAVEPREGPTPNFDRFLSEVTGGDKHAIKTLWQIVGWSLAPYVPVEAAFVFLRGDGRDGKGVFCEVIRQIVGPENTSAILPHEVNQVTTERLASTLVNIATETEAGTLPEGLFKLLSAQESKTVNPKYRDPYEVQPLAKLIVAFNNPPALRDFTRAFKERCLVVRFVGVPPEKRDPLYFERRLRQELPFIAHKAIKALQELIKQGKFYKAGAVKEATEELLKETNPVEVFLDELVEAIGEERLKDKETHALYWVKGRMLILSEPSQSLETYTLEKAERNGWLGVRVRRNDLHEAFNTWAQVAGYANLNRQTFFRRVRDLIRRVDPLTIQGKRYFFIYIVPSGADTTGDLFDNTSSKNDDFKPR